MATADHRRGRSRGLDRLSVRAVRWGSRMISTQNRVLGCVLSDDLVWDGVRVRAVLAVFAMRARLG